MRHPIRVATAVLSERIFAGWPTKDGTGFKEPRYDVTSDVLVAVKDKVGIGNEITVECEGVPQFRIVVLPIGGDRAPSAKDAENEALRERIEGRVEEASKMFHNSQRWIDEDAPTGEGSLWDWIFASEAPAQGGE